MHITRSVCRHVPWLFHGRRVFRQLSRWKNRNVYTNESRSNSKASVIIAAGATAEGPPTARITCAPPVTGQSTERKTDKESSCTVSNAGSLGQSEESARSRPAFNRPVDEELDDAAIVVFAKLVRRQVEIEDGNFLCIKKIYFYKQIKEIKICFK